MFALFVALGGASVAATNDFLPKNSVGTAQIKNDSVTAAKIAHNSISSMLVKNGSLMAVDFAAGQIPAGPQGAKGDTGATGSQGPKGDTGATGATGKQGPPGVMGTMAVAQNSATVYANGGTTSLTVMVPDSKQATGASASWGDLVKGTDWSKLGYISVKPIITPAGHVSGYEATAFNGDKIDHSITLYVPYG
jgi:hypothetical protein